MMSWLLLLNVAGVKKRGNRKIDRFNKRLMIPESEIPECPEQEVKSKIGNIFVNEKTLEEYSVKIDTIDPYFCEHYKEKIQVDKNGYEYIAFRIDAHFTDYLLPVEIDEACWYRPYFWGEKTKSTGKKLGCKFIRIYTSKEGYDADYEASRIKTFISKFKDRKLKNYTKN